MIKFSDGQQAAISGVIKDIVSGKPETSMGGLAGTGKSTCTKEIIRQMDSRIPYIVLCPTGKAANVQRANGVPADTIHSAIYNYKGKREDDKGKEHMIWKKKAKVTKAPRVMFVDEASMVDAKIYEDIMKFGLQVVWIGDYGQLPPIGKDPGIMRNPKYVLSEVYRNTGGIVNFAHDVRKNTLNKNGYNDVQFSNVWYEKLIANNEYDQIICGFNPTRRRINNFYREDRGFKGSMNEGEKLICIQNNKKLGIFNGQPVMINKILAETEYRFKVLAETDTEGEQELWVSKLGFNCEVKPEKNVLSDNEILCDYGYAITCHKSQGSEWDKVLVINQRTPNWDHTRWLYTAVTRAAKDLTIKL